MSLRLYVPYAPIPIPAPSAWHELSACRGVDTEQENNQK